MALTKSKKVFERARLCLEELDDFEYEWIWRKLADLR